MNVLNVIFAYFIFMAVIQVHEKLLCTNDFIFCFQNTFDSALCLQRSLY